MQRTLRIWYNSDGLRLDLRLSNCNWMIENAFCVPRAKCPFPGTMCTICE